MYTLGTAAKATGLAKSTIHRAIKLGKISARSKDGNGYEIDPAELHRVYPFVKQGVASNPDENSSAERSATYEENGSDASRTPVARDYDLELRLARTEAQLEVLKEVLEMERKRSEELRQERDKWSAALEASQRQITHITSKAAEIEDRRGWWPFRRAG